MKMVVTGATSGLGRNMAEAFLVEGHSVLALGRNKDSGRALETLGAEFLQGNIEDREYLRRALRGQEMVIHCAAHTSPWGPWDEFERANIQGTRNVVDACLDTGVERLIHISTPSIYFSGQPAELIEEDDPLPEPLTHYARSKKIAEDVVTEAVDKHGLPAILLRPRAIYGRYDRSILPRVLRVMRRGFFPLPSGGTAKIDITATQNVVHAARLCLTADRSCFGRAYNITNGEPMAVRDLMELVSQELQIKTRLFRAPYPLLDTYARGVEILSQITGQEPPFTRYSMSLLGVTQTLSLERARRELEYIPQVSTIEGLKAFSEWWRS